MTGLVNVTQVASVRHIPQLHERGIVGRGALLSVKGDVPERLLHDYLFVMG